MAAQGGPGRWTSFAFVSPAVASIRSPPEWTIRQRYLRRTCTYRTATRAAAMSNVIVDWDGYSGVLEICGEDHLSFLQNQSTNSFSQGTMGDSKWTCFTTSTGRMLDLGLVSIQAESAFVVCSETRRQSLMDTFDRVIFPFDKVSVRDVSEDYMVLSACGGDCTAFLSDDDIIVKESGFSFPGMTILTKVSGRENLLSQFAREGYLIIHDQMELERMRVQDGRPRADQEITEEYNPLEAGLWKTVSFAKGCYRGQETLARLNTYDGVKQQLYGIQFEGFVPVHSPVTTADGERAGKVTSTIEDGTGCLSLAYIRRRANSKPDSKVFADGIQGTVFDLPFATRSIEECADR